MEETDRKLIETVLRHARLNMISNYDYVFEKTRAYLEGLAEEPYRLPSSSLPWRVRLNTMDATTGAFLSGYIDALDLPKDNSSTGYDDDDVCEHALNALRLQLEEVGGLDVNVESATRHYMDYICDRDMGSQPDMERYFSTTAFANGFMTAKRDMESGYIDERLAAEPRYNELKSRYHKTIEQIIDSYFDDENVPDAQSFIYYIDQHASRTNIDLMRLKRLITNCAVAYAENVLLAKTGSEDHGTMQDQANTLMRMVGAYMRSAELWLTRQNVRINGIPAEMSSNFDDASQYLHDLMTHCGLSVSERERRFGIQFTLKIESEGNTVTMQVDMAAAIGAAVALHDMVRHGYAVSPQYIEDYMYACGLIDGETN